MFSKDVSDLMGRSKGENDSSPALEEARHWFLTGRVQGVGYRPFVYRLAIQHGLVGWVQNRLGDVEIVAQGKPRDLTAFHKELFAQAPPLAEPRFSHIESEPLAVYDGFKILPSGADGQANIHVPVDGFTCGDCLEELSDPADRRYRYPFINCTQCGPRYTLINELPYDRVNTTMAAFSLCDACRSEYENTADRRFHAEPIACADCGPSLTFHAPGGSGIGDTEHALKQCINFLRAGRIVAVKGIGGYHLMCDARNDTAVRQLRRNKPRPHKPLAVLFPAPVDDELSIVGKETVLSDREAEFLRSPARPIVLVKKSPGGSLSRLIAPDLQEIGVFLPYSPLHHLLLEEFGGPLVATSGNISGEPVLTENDVVETRLGQVADAFLHHNRSITRPADDAVFREIHKVMRPIRLGRGCAPLELTLPFTLKQPVVAVGGHMKNTIALGWDDRVVLSPHIGDMGTPRSFAVFQQTVEDLQRLYSVRAQAVVCDAHPGYATSRWARQSDLPVHEIFHHYAHASALAGESDSPQSWLVFAWDGVGLGEDGTLWGGEALLGRPGQWRRRATMRSFRLPGGDKASREPWRSAAALCWETGQRCYGGRQEDSLLHEAWSRQINAPVTTAVGRLFDAAAALIGLCNMASFEAQGPMNLEAACSRQGKALDLPIAKNEQGLWVTDWEPLIPYLQDDHQTQAERAMGFHKTMARVLVQQALHIRKEHEFHQVGLCGGVFQNRVLTELVENELRNAGINLFIPEKVPLNDAGLSFGQIIEYAYRSGAR